MALALTSYVTLGKSLPLSGLYLLFLESDRYRPQKISFPKLSSCNSDGSQKQTAGGWQGGWKAKAH